MTCGKAIGNDGLSDLHLKLVQTNPIILLKLQQVFNFWFNSGKIPHYAKSARVVPLSKEDTEYPQYSKIRPICVLPAVYKLYERCVLQLLNIELEIDHLKLHPAQRGFRKGHSIYNNLIDTTRFVLNAHT